MVTYIITEQCHYANVCGKALCERTYAYGGRHPHIIRGTPRRPAPAGSRQRWLYACECTHAALSLEARHWLLKRVAPGGGGRRAFRAGDQGEAPSVPAAGQRHLAARSAVAPHDLYAPRKPPMQQVQTAGLDADMAEPPASDIRPLAPKHYSSRQPSRIHEHKMLQCAKTCLRSAVPAQVTARGSASAALGAGRGRDAGLV